LVKHIRLLRPFHEDRNGPKNKKRFRQMSDSQRKDLKIIAGLAAFIAIAVIYRLNS